MASAFYILNARGTPLVYRSYRGDVTQNVSEVFARRVLDEEELRITPVFEEHGATYVYIRVNDVYLLLVSMINACVLLQIAFLRRCVEVFERYFRKVSEETVVDNFVIVYELLDEMCDFGYPQYTEPNMLKTYITQRGLLDTLLSATTGGMIDLSNGSFGGVVVGAGASGARQLPSAAVTGGGAATPWRVASKRYAYSRNEVFLDVVERVNVLIGQDGELLSSEIVGSLQMNARLSGMPTLRVGLNDKLFFDMHSMHGKAVSMDDVKFHRCVRLNQFESERVISFVPPDGTFELLTYRCSGGTSSSSSSGSSSSSSASSRHAVPPVTVTCTVVRHGTSRVELLCAGRSNFRRSITATLIEVLLPVPSDADKPRATCSHGRTEYVPETSALSWTMHNVGGGREFSCRAEYHLPSVRSSDASARAKAPVQVRFSVPYFAASGLQVRFVKITEQSGYEATPWVRYVTQSGDYQVRTH